MKRDDSRGQFYLLAAIVIIGIIIGFVAILNYSKRTSQIRIYDLAEELEIESEAVLDYSKKTDDDKVEDFTSKFDAYAGDNPEIYYIKNNEAYRYVDGNKENIQFSNEGGIITVGINNEVSYQFEAKPGENFYFVMIQEIENEKYVVTN